MNLQEFGQTIKQKYPQYQSIDDTQLANKIIEKYPEYKSRITETAQEKGFLSNVGEDLSKRGQSIKETFKQTASGQINPLETGIQTVGAVAGGVGDVIGQGLISTAKAVLPKSAEQAIASGVSKLATTKPVQNVLSGYESWKGLHPEAAKNLESVVNIASLLPIGKGAQIGAKAVETAAKTGEKLAAKTIAGVGERMAEKAVVKNLDNVLNIVRPELTTAEKAAAIAQKKGTPAGIFKKAEIIPSNREIEIAEAAKTFVNPKKGFIENSNSIKTGIENEAENLITGIKKNDSIFNVSQIESKLNSIERPVAIISEQSLDNAYTRTQQKMIDIIKGKPKKLSELLQARKEFDIWVEKQFGNLYSTEKWTPMRSAITDMRKEVNNFIASKLKGAEAVKFKKSLKKQNLLFEALDNTSHKATKEVGKSKAQRVLEKPAVKRTLQYVGPAALGAAGYGAVRSLGN